VVPGGLRDLKDCGSRFVYPQGIGQLVSCVVLPIWTTRLILGWMRGRAPRRLADSGH